MRPLAVVGNVNVDLILGPTTPWPKPGTEIMVEHDEIRVGGQAGNCALVWQNMGLDFQVAATTGSDEFGHWLRGAFGTHAANWVEAEENTTLSVGLTHPDGERTFFTTTGHLPRMSLGNVLAALDAERLAGGYVLLCGAFLTNDLTEDYSAFLDWAGVHDITVALDTGWPVDGWTEFNTERTRRWLSRCGVSLLNEIETTTLAGRADPVEAARVLKSGMPDGAIIVVKRGPEGALAIGAEDRLVSVPVPKVQVIDTIGAGDVFDAAFLAALASGKTLEDCLTFGVEVASRAISTKPRRYDLDTHQQET